MSKEISKRLKDMEMCYLLFMQVAKIVSNRKKLISSPDYFNKEAN